MEVDEETEDDDAEESEEYEETPPKKKPRKTKTVATKNAPKNAKAKKSAAAPKKAAAKKSRKKKLSPQPDVNKEEEDNPQPDVNKEEEDEEVDVKPKIEKVTKLEGDVQFLDADGKIIACRVSDIKSDHSERLVQGMRSRIVSGQVCDCKFIVTIYGYIILF